MGAADTGRSAEVSGLRAAVAGAVALGIAGLPLAWTPARAGTIIWANDARGSPGPLIDEWDLDEAAGTGTLGTSFLAPDPAAQGQGGAGIAVVGSSIYYSVSTSGSVFLTDTSGNNLGVAFNTGLPGISTITSDGQFLYLGGTNDQNVHKYTFGGTLVSTTILVPAERPAGLGRVGLEIVGTDFVANQQQDIGPYDKFASDGTLITAQFIGVFNDFGKTGIAFDGTFYYTGDDEADPSVFKVYNGSGNFVKDLALTGCPLPNHQCDFRVYPLWFRLHPNRLR